ncbi:RDD family protein [Salisediminibacterium halotolerans]|uniref:Uncharacterized membrane protein YckC, RDD family n=1 Tax=Salisediminibacterium halotolerans TaxID=517425 RepID=A0A1H9V7L5_9BACI|nr:RDD family protein [Salisediminibacterium haloalkalitolerans]SES17253.1 Uncharacterized membrane protein YckC, RDD family [Salisediminibacterium haloalkalitolerans]
MSENTKHDYAAEEREQDGHDETEPALKDTGAEEPLYFAGFWMRFWAYLFDLLIVVSLNGIVLGLGYFAADLEAVTIGVFTLAGIFTSAVSFGYFTVMTKLTGQTLGKMLFGLRVIAHEDRELTWTDCLFREVIGRYIHQSLVFTNLLYLIVAFSPDKRGLHDRIGHTCVVLEPRKSKRTVRQSETGAAQAV